MTTRSAEKARGLVTSTGRRPGRGAALSVPGEQTCQIPAQRRAQGARAARYQLRRGLWRVSKLERLWKCGRYLRNDQGTGLRLKDGGAYYDGVVTCGSIWACPVCAARIRQRRAQEIERAAVLHLGAGGGIGFATLTLPHSSGDDLAGLLGVVQLAWEKVQQNGTVRRLFEQHQVFGRIRSTEITYGSWHGWHPHLHVLLFAEAALSDAEWDRVRDALATAWAAAVVRLGRERPGAEVGVTLGRVERAEVGQYLAKVQDHYGDASTVGLEMARGDAKKGRKRSRTPFELAEQACDGLMTEVDLWHEYERATKGRRAIEWSRGLKARFEVEEVDDEDLAAADVDGERLAWIDEQQWVLIVARRQEAQLLDIAEDGGGAAVHDFLRELRRGDTP